MTSSRETHSTGAARNELFSRLTGVRQELFAELVGLVAAGAADELRALHSGEHPWHEVVAEIRGYRNDPAVVRRLGAPYRPGQQAPVHALRALAGLALGLVDEAAVPTAVRAALRWPAAAHSSFSPAAPVWPGPRPVPDDPRLRRCLNLLAAPDLPPGAALTAALVLRHLAGAAPARKRPQSVGVLYTFRTGEGRRARLKAALVTGEPPGLVPDPARMSLFAADERFGETLGRAWSHAGSAIRGTVVWSLETDRGPVPYVEDASFGAAFAVVLDELHRRSRLLGPARVFRLRSGHYVVGALGRSDVLASVRGYPGKLAAAGRSRVIIPEVDRDATYDHDVDAELVPALTWRAAARRARGVNRWAALRLAVAASMAVILVVVLAAAYFRGRAEDTGKIAFSRQLAGSATQVTLDDPGLAGLLAVQARAISPTKEAEAALFAALTAGPSLVRYGTAREQSRYRDWIKSPTGKHAAVVRPDGRIDVINAANAATERTLPADPDGAPFRTDVAWNPDETRLAISGLGGMVRVFDTATGRMLASVRAPGRLSIARPIEPPALEFTPEGKTLFISAYDTIQPYRSDNLAPLSGRWPEDQPEGAYPVSFAVTPSAGHLLACQGGSVVEYDLAPLRVSGAFTPLERIKRRTLAASPQGCKGLSLSPDGHYLAINHDTGVTLRSYPDGQPIGTEHTFNKSFFEDATWDQESGLVLLRGQDRMEIVRLPSGQILRTFRDAEIPGVTNRTNVVKAWFSADATQVGVLLQDGPLLWLSLAARSPLAVAALGGIDGDSGVAVAGDRVAAYDGYRWGLWYLSTKQRVATLSPQPAVEPSPGPGMTFSRDGSVLVGGTDEGVQIWDGNTGIGTATIPESALFLAVSPDGRYVATGLGAGSSGSGGTVTLWSLRDGGRVEQVRRSGPIAPAGMAFTDSGNELVIGEGPNLTIWRTTDRGAPTVQSARLRGEIADVTTNGDRVYAALFSGSVEIMDLKTLRRAQDPPPINTDSLQIDGGRIMAQTQTGVEIWDLATGRRLGTLPLPRLKDRKISPLSFSADHRTAYATLPDGLAVLAWDPERWTTLACARAARRLTTAEWRRYLGDDTPYAPACPG